MNDASYKKQAIYTALHDMETANQQAVSKLTDSVSLTAYRSFVRTSEDGRLIWTDAFREALKEHEVLFIPASKEPYYIDDSVLIPSNRHIEADPNAVIRQLPGVPVLMFRNEHPEDGTHFPENKKNRDCNISINGGRWEESRTERAGYGRSGMYDRERSYYGVSACMLFSNLTNLTLTNMTFAHTGGFSVQFGNINNVVCRNITFVECYADGLHFNGNTEKVLIDSVKGQVGDDLVALNLYDWQDSSINFGPMKTVLCQNLELSEDSRYKALRILPGIYYYKDGTSVDCALQDTIIKNVKGIRTFKLYYQTAAYELGSEPERGGVGSGDNIFFEDISIVLERPLEGFEPYKNSHPQLGSFAGFEIGSNLGNLYLDNIHITLRKDLYPMSFLVCAGPKSVRLNGREIFDPDANCVVDNLHLSRIFVNGERVADVSDYVHAIVLDDPYGDGTVYSRGEINHVYVDEPN